MDSRPRRGAHARVRGLAAAWITGPGAHLLAGTLDVVELWARWALRRLGSSVSRRGGR